MNRMTTLTGSPRQSGGFSLLEVMLAVAILSFALLSLAALQSTLIRSSSDSKARSTATTLAQGIGDRFRGFEQLAPETGHISYGDIVDGALGDDSIFGGTSSEYPDGKITRSNVEFSADWDVTDYYYDDVNGVFSTTPADPDAPGTPDFKRIEIGVTWLDGTGASQSIVIEDIIAKTTPQDSGRVITDERTSSVSPKVGYTPQPAPEVVRVPTLGVGGGRFKETSKPLPDVLRNDFSTITTFSTVTFDSDGEDGFVALRQEDFFVVNCVCQFAAETDDYVGKDPTVWDGSKYVGGGERTGKLVGATAGDVLGGQPGLCTACCRDHHDDKFDNADGELYDPFRSSSDYNDQGDHKHYYADDAGVLTEIGASPGSVYFEACRFVRKDGLLEVSQDFNLEAFNLMPASQLQRSTGLAAYQLYVVNFVTEYLQAIVNLGDTYPATLPDTSAFSAQFTADAVALGDLPVQFLSRGVYVDYINPELLNCIRNRAGIGVNDDTATICRPESGGPLDITPFYEVNVTRLANWSYEGNINVTSEPISDGTEETYSRGLGTLNPVGATDTSVTVAMERSNSGLTDSRPIDPEDAADASTFGDNLVLLNTIDRQEIVITGSLALAGQISSVTPSDVTVQSVAITTGPLGNVITLSEDPMLCVKPTDDTIRCVIQVADPDVLITGLVIKVSNFSDEFQQGNNLNFEDNIMCGAGTAFGTSTTVGAGSAGEFEVIRLIDFMYDNSGTAGANEYTLNLNAKTGNRSC